MKKSLLVMCLVAVCGAAVAGPEDAYTTTADIKKIAWMKRGMDAVKSQLKDAGSAQFQNVYFHKGADGMPMTCGEVNSTNSFGGYSGYQRFISAGSADLTFIEEQVSGFHSVWQRFC